MFRVWVEEWALEEVRIGEAPSLAIATRTLFGSEAEARAYVSGCVDMCVLPADVIPSNATAASRQSIRQEQER